MSGDFGRYRLEHEIGRGSMGTVYLARDPFLDRPVALKVTRPDDLGAATRDPELYEALFYNEMRTASLLRHPNVVQVYDAGNEDGTFYIAMEYVEDGRTLEPHCHPRALLPLDQVADIVFRCAEALDYAHAKGVIHRDVKPANVLLGEDGVVKLADFSIALLFDPRIVDTQLVLPAGSPLYMSPEQIREQPLTNQSDLFSLGIVLYELLTGRHPFAASNLPALTQRILHETPPAIARYRADVPAAFQRILDRSLAKDLASRYPNALALAADLGQVFSALKRPQDGITTEGRAESLRELSIFESFHDAEIWELLRWAEWEEHDDAAEIVREGDEDDSVYVLVRGEVSVRKGEREVARLDAGECFGEIAYLSRRHRTASVIARGPVAVMRINAHLLDRASESCQLQFQRMFIRVLIDRLVDTTGALASR